MARESGPATQPDGGIVTTDIPARLDRLPWSRWHTMVVVALGITWLLDGLEGNLAGALPGYCSWPRGLEPVRQICP